MDIGNVGGNGGASGAAELSLEYQVNLQKKALDQQQLRGMQAVELIDAAGPQKRTPPPGATISVVA
jgi:hypothetical protein